MECSGRTAEEGTSRSIQCPCGMILTDARGASREQEVVPIDDSDRNRLSSTRLLVIVAMIASVALGFSGRMWWRSSHYAETDNAYVLGHVHPVSSRISGVITRVLAEDNQIVKEGDVLAELDMADQRVKVEEIETQITAAQHQVMQAEAQIKQARAQAMAAVAQLEQVNAQLQRARQDAERYNSLYLSERGAVSQAEVDAANATKSSAIADLSTRRHIMLAAQAQVAATELSRDVIQSRIQLLQVHLRDAKQQLAYNRIVAPVDGRIGKRTMEVGARIVPGQQLAAIVQGKLWVVANFKETQVTKLRSGNAVEVFIDALPSETLTAHIDSFSPASGAQFSLLPPDNATGNYTKIVQRIPVKITLHQVDVDRLGDKLIVGMSAAVQVNLSQ